MIRELRARRSKSERAQVSHLFDDDTYWFPYRSALCGREILGSQLTDRVLLSVPLCAQCKRRIPDWPARESVA